MISAWNFVLRSCSVLFFFFFLSFRCIVLLSSLLVFCNIFSLSPFAQLKQKSERSAELQRLQERTLLRGSRGGGADDDDASSDEQQSDDEARSARQREHELQVMVMQEERTRKMQGQSLSQQPSSHVSIIYLT